MFRIVSFVLVILVALSSTGRGVPHFMTGNSDTATFTVSAIQQSGIHEHSKMVVNEAADQHGQKSPNSDDSNICLENCCTLGCQQATQIHANPLIGVISVSRRVSMIKVEKLVGSSIPTQDRPPRFI